MKRLVLLSTEFPPGPGGIGTHAHQLALQLHALGWEIAVVSPQDYTSDEERERFTAAQPIAIDSPRRSWVRALDGLARLRLTRRRLRNGGADVALATGKTAVWLAALAAGRARVPWVAMAHGSEFGGGESWDGRLTRWAFARATAVVCISEFTRGHMLAAGVRPRRAVVIHNGADTDRFARLAPTEIRRFRVENGLERHCILTVGNVTERKGQELIVRALPQVRSRVPDVLYVMVGLPTRRAHLEALARELGVLDRVRFVGPVDGPTLVRYMNACDVFAMTSRRTADGDVEGFGIAVIEAALCGKPAVVSRGSGLAEAIVHGETGLAVAEDDVDGAADALSELLGNDVLRRRMGECAQQRALREQSWAHCAAEYDALLSSIVAEGR